MALFVIMKNWSFKCVYIGKCLTDNNSMEYFVPIREYKINICMHKDL